MSYEPRLVISYEDLVRTNLGASHNEEGTPEYYLEGIIKPLQNSPEKISQLRGVKMVICQPEFTSFNAEVREWLDDNEVEYTTDW